ncbi:MAG: hypothetical protein WC289_05755 [Patescibacteria group bacterium]
MAVSHCLTTDEVIRRVRNDLRNKLNQAFSGKISTLDQRWSGSTGTFTAIVDGRTITGAMSVTQSQFCFTADLPMGASLLINIDKTKASIQKHIEELLA